MTVVLFILTVAVFIGIEAIRLHMARSHETAGAGSAVRAFSDIRIPQGLFLGENHTWARLTPLGEMQLGMDELLSQAIGGADRVDLPTAGAKISRGDTLATVYRRGRTLKLTSPIDGTVVTANTALNTSARSLEEDPYGSAWLLRVWPEDHASALGTFKVGQSAVQWLRRETQRFCDFLSTRTDPDLMGMAMADGAHPIIGSAQSLDDDAFVAFEKEFTLIS